MAAVSHLSHLIDRPDSRVSLARSDTTYHSFQDIDLFEPEVPPQPSPAAPIVRPGPLSPSSEKEENLAREMRRQDSGYESIARQDSQSSRRRTSSTSLPNSARPRRGKRSGHHREARAHRPRNGRHSAPPPGSSRPLSQQSQQQITYFHFPHFTSSDPTLGGEAELALDPHGLNAHDLAPGPRPDYALALSSEERPAAAYHPPPPQTTHYWTSDRTRRLEYAAIDAASKGIRGWVMRHVVPDCFVPESKRRLGFEDDRGSVVRYRLDLDAEETTSTAGEKAESVRSSSRGGWRGWWFSVRRR